MKMLVYGLVTGLLFGFLLQKGRCRATISNSVPFV